MDKKRTNPLSRLLTEAMARQGITGAAGLQQRLKGQVTISTRQLGKFLNGQAQPSQEKLPVFADALGIPLKSLLVAVGARSAGITTAVLLNSIPHAASVEPKEAERLASYQRSALQATLLIAGNEDLRGLFEDDLAWLPASPKPLVKQAIVEVLRTVDEFRGAAQGPYSLSLTERGALVRALTTALSRLNGLWRRSQSTLNILRRAENRNLDEELLAEYVLGLGYFEVLAHLPRIIDAAWMNGIERKLVDGACSRASYVAGLDGAFRLHDAFLSAIAQPTVDVGERPWEIFASALSAVDPFGTLSAELRGAASLRVCPSAIEDSVPPTATAAQLLHWVGWGGDGSLFDGLEHSPSGLLRCLSEHRRHAFDWHGRREHESSASKHFTHRMSQFANASLRIANYAAACAAVLALDPVLRGDASGTVRLWADGVGPSAIAERRIESYLGASIGAVITEISPVFVHELSKNPTVARWGGGVIWRDLNRPFPGERDEPVPDDWRERLRHGSYDIYSCSLALHQIADGRAGRRRLEQVLAFATRLVRPGGVLSLPDVGPGVHLQAFLLAINLVDREGGWHPAGVWGPEMWQKIACRPDGAFGLPGNAADKVHIPLPLLGLRRGTPTVLDTTRDLDHGPHGGEGPIYEYVPCVVVDLSRGDLDDLCDAWGHARGTNERAAAVRRTLAAWREGAGDIEARVADRLRDLSVDPAPRGAQ